ncbi:MAG: hypothetical protein WCE44_04260 [Candidatus Velthaea sp.]
MTIFRSGPLRWAAVSRALSLALSAVVLASCASPVDLDAVKKFTAGMSASGPAFDAIAADLYATCRETREFVGATRFAGGDPLSTRPLEPPFPPRPTDPPVAASPAPSPAPATSPSPQPIESATPGDPHCLTAASLGRRWKLENDAVLAYVKSLGELAGVTTAPDAKSFETLGAGLKTAGLLSSDAVAKASGDFVAALGNAMLRRRQDRSIAEIVALANADGVFAKIVGQLRQTVATQYDNMLRNEKSVVDAYFVQTIDRELAELIALRRENGLDPDPIVPVDQSTAAPPAAPSPVPAKPCDRACQDRWVRIVELRSAIDTLRVRWDGIDSDIARRASAIAPYYKTMYDLERTQARLNKGAMGLQSLVDAVRPYFDDLSAQTTALIEALRAPAAKKT